MNNEYAFNRRRLNNIKEIFEEKTGTELPKKCSSVPKGLRSVPQPWCLPSQPFRS